MNWHEAFEKKLFDNTLVISYNSPGEYVDIYYQYNHKYEYIDERSSFLDDKDKKCYDMM